MNFDQRTFEAVTAAVRRVRHEQAEQARAEGVDALGELFDHRSRLTRDIITGLDEITNKEEQDQ